MHASGTHLFPTMDRVIFGQAAAAALAAEVDRLGKSKVFLMVSRTLNTTTGEIEKLRTALGGRFAGLYDQVPQHTSRQGAVDAALAACAVNADLVVAVGGGSVIDAAKITLICMEYQIFEPDTPETLWLGSGTRAMDHAIEALCSHNGTPPVDASVLRGIELMVTNLPDSQANPDNVRLRGQCQIASWLCSAGLQARVWMGASHAIGHVLGGSFGVAHYLCTPIMMQGVLRYNQPATEQAQSELAKALGRPGGNAVDALGEFFVALGLPTRLGDVGIKESQFETISRITMQEEIFIYTNPRSIKKWEDVCEILKLAA